LSDKGQAKLSVGGQSAYQLLLCLHDAYLRDAANVRGEPRGTFLSEVTFTDNATGSATSIPPSNKSYAGRGFYVVGPPPDHEFFDPGVDPRQHSEDPQLRSSYQSPAMLYRVNAGNLPSPTVLLRRLACPYLPANE